MPSPDATPYIDLRLYDKSPQDIYDAAVFQLQTELPEWVPREGNIEVLLLEALALEVSEGAYTINRLPSGIMQGLLTLFGVNRDNGSAPVASLTFTLANSLGYTIPAGTLARLTLPGGLEPVVFSTDIDLVVAPGNDDGTVTATGDRFTADANNFTATSVELLDSILYVETVVLDSVTTPGTSPETDADYFSRGATRFSRLSDTLVLPRHFTAYALENVAIKRATTLDNWDSVGGAPGDDAGHVTVAVYGDNAFVSAPVKTALQAEMEALATTNLQVHVIDPTITTINVTSTVRAHKGFTQAEVQANVVAALEEYLNPMTWLWGTTVLWTELVTVISTAEGVDYLDTMSTPSDNTSLTGYATLVDAGTLTITVDLAA